MNVAFLNENTLGHTSYLPRFAESFRRDPDLGIRPYEIDVLPLPPHLRRLGDTSIRGLRKFGLDFHGTRWRLAVSRHAREQLDGLRARAKVDAVVVNTQSVGLALGGLPAEIPVFVALDATFTQLSNSPWFAPNRPSRWLQPLTLRSLFRMERRLFGRTTHFLPWSEPVAHSLRDDYAVAPGRMTLLPPSMEAPPRRTTWPQHARPQILFIGGHFERKGGPLLLEVFRRHFADRCDLHLVTATDVSAEPNVFVHRGIQAGSEAWLRRWSEADVFVFPSALETFGIVLIEALAFEVPVVASTAGAARWVLDGGGFGVLVENLDVQHLGAGVRSVVDGMDSARARSQRARLHFEGRYELGRAARSLAELIRIRLQAGAV
jgi:glycosyltransferase involved in cell wall biosynthesis